MRNLLEINRLTVELPTAQGRVRPVNVAQIATRIAVMRSGKLVETGDAGRVLSQPSEKYPKNLLAAVPELPVHP
jgi:ABC-type antimicrobial peptide transport system ATPase subunit